MPDRWFARLLDRYPRRYRPLGEPEELGGAGGLSGARLWRFRSEQGPMAWRGWPPDGPDRAHLVRVHRWLLRAADLGFVPAPIVDLSGGTLQESDGRFWELAPWMPGAAEVARPPATARVRSAFAAMAAFHLRLGDERRAGPSPGLGRRYAAVAGLLRGGLDDLERAIRRPDGAPDDEARTTALRWLDRARSDAPRLLDPLREAAGRVVPLQPCLRDARPEHVLFEDDRVSGLVDYGAMGVDCVAGDLARLMGEWFDDDPSCRAEALAAYERVRPIDPAEAGLIDAFVASSDLLIGEHWIRWHFLEGRRFDDLSAVPRGIARGLARLGRRAGDPERRIVFVGVDGVS